MLYFALLPFSTNWQISQRDWNGGVQHRVVMYAVWLKLIDYAESLDRANVFTDHFCAPNIWALWRASENKSFFTVDCMIVDVCGRTARSSLLLLIFPVPDRSYACCGQFVDGWPSITYRNPSVPSKSRSDHQSYLELSNWVGDSLLLYA